MRKKVYIKANMTSYMNAYMKANMKANMTSYMNAYMNAYMKANMKAVSHKLVFLVFSHTSWFSWFSLTQAGFPGEWMRSTNFKRRNVQHQVKKKTPPQTPITRSVALL